MQQLSRKHILQAQQIMGWNMLLHGGGAVA